MGDHGASAEIIPAVGAVLYRPDPAILRRCLAALQASGGGLFLFCNGPLDPALATELARLHPDATLIRSTENLGVAAALNRLANAAAAAGHRRLALFDQDSEPPPGMVAALSRAMDRLVAAGERPAVLGPSLLASPEGEARHKPPRLVARRGRSPVQGLRPVQFLATSGSLVDLAAFGEVGPFREDYFIDAVDLEWCFRAWSRGFSCWADPDVAMVHRVGAGVIEARALGLAMPRQKPFRMATYIRNSVYGFRLPHIPLGWKLKQAAYLPVQALLYWRASGYDRRVMALMARACRDGFAGRLGRPPDLA